MASSATTPTKTSTEDAAVVVGEPNSNTSTEALLSLSPPPPPPLSATGESGPDNNVVHNENNSHELQNSDLSAVVVAAAAPPSPPPPAVVNPISDFVTTSFVIDSINEALENVMKLEQQRSSDDDDNNNKNRHHGETKKEKFFELQKRMPDGSTRKATEEEMSSEDMKNKLEQAAQLTSKMTLEQKREWAQKQRHHGNQLYQEGKYKEAIDIYLTCLVARDMRTTKQQQAVVEDDQEDLMLPVMNNLAQCALQLGWYHKAETFCTLALESLDQDSRGQSVAKLYYKRGKARRLRGWYDEAKRDLEQSLNKLGAKTDDANNKDKSPEQKSIEREFQLLAKAVEEGKKNKKRAQLAMQKVLGAKSDEMKDATTISNMAENTDASKDQGVSSIDMSPTTPLYHEKHGRTHSTIRKRPEGPPPYERVCIPVELSYWQMYRLVAARVAQKLLEIIGEEEGTGFGSRPLSTSEERTQARPKQD